MRPFLYFALIGPKKLLKTALESSDKILKSIINTHGAKNSIYLTQSLFEIKRFVCIKKQ